MVILQEIKTRLRDRYLVKVTEQPGFVDSYHSSVSPLQPSVNAIHTGLACVPPSVVFAIEYPYHP